MVQCILGRFDFLQNEFEMRLAKKIELRRDLFKGLNSFKALQHFVLVLCSCEKCVEKDGEAAQ